MPDIFSAPDLRCLALHPFLRRFDYFQQLPSTNDLALKLALAENAESPLLVLSGRQTAGRGRGDNRWWSADGALTCSLLLSRPDEPLSERPAPWVSLITGLAVCEALQSLLPSGSSVGLKWPNDVCLDRRKVCGILVEAPPRRVGKLVVGIGINVNNSLAGAPDELSATAVALCDIFPERYRPADVLLAVLDRLAERWRSNPSDSDLAGDWQPFCLLRGRTVQLAIGPRRAVGRCRGIDGQGALLLETDSGVERHYSGVVVRVEP